MAELDQANESLPLPKAIRDGASEDGVVGVVSMVGDAAEQKLAEVALRRSEARYRILVDSLPDTSILVFDREKRFLVAGGGEIKKSGFDRASVLGHTLAEAYPPAVAELFSPLYDRALSGEMITFEHRYGDLHYRQHILPIYDDDGEIRSGMVVSLNITERKKAEEREKELREKLERVARMESLGVLAGGVAHDLNNVLGPMVVLPDIVQDYVSRHDDETDPGYTDAMESLRVMKDSALRAKNVVSDLVVLGRRGQIRKEPLDVNRVIEQTLESRQIQALRERRPDVVVTKRLSVEPVTCQGSDSRLVRVLANLIGNAVEAIEGLGDVVVCASRKVLSEPYNGYESVPAGTYVVLEVADNGCGMDAPTLARIFEPFFSTKAPNERSGSGLGLSVVYGLVKDHEGFLDVRSQPGQGTTFTVYLPAVEPAGVSDSPPAPVLFGGQERILVVDDEAGQRQLALLVLKKLGYNVTVVANGMEAKRLFEAARQAGLPAPFDLVMTDMVMDGLDGLTLCQWILEGYPAQKLLITSGHSAEELEKQSRALDIGWLIKPYTRSDLARAVRDRLDR